MATAPRGLKWFQLYVTSDRQLNKQLVQRAEALGFKALVITVDAPKIGNRRCDIRNQVDLQMNLLLKDLRSPKEVGKTPDPMETNFFSSFLPSLLPQKVTECLLLPDTAEAMVQKVDWVPAPQSYQVNRIHPRTSSPPELANLSPEVLWPGLGAKK